MFRAILFGFALGLPAGMAFCLPLVVQLLAKESLKSGDLQSFVMQQALVILFSLALALATGLLQREYNKIRWPEKPPYKLLIPVSITSTFMIFCFLCIGFVF